MDARSSNNNNSNSCTPPPPTSAPIDSKEEGGDACCPNPTTTTTTTEQSTTPSPPKPPKFNPSETLTTLRSLRARELRTLCTNAGIRWGTIIEKEDLVQLLFQHQLAASQFSPSGTLTPGKVSDVSDEVLAMEMNMPGVEEGELVPTPLLVDVYATWCGPCQMMAPQLEMAAMELGGDARVVKMDSDKYPELSGRLRVQGLP